MIVIVPYRPTWPDEFREFARPLREVMGDTALAIHHIGSTSVPGLDAKDVIDIQITVADLKGLPTVAIQKLGYTYRTEIVNDHCPPGEQISPRELEKRYFSRKDRPVHVHVRVQGRFNQRYALLCRDYLRTHPMAANAYAEVKRQLARYFPEDTEAYYAVKDPVFDILMAGAFEWAQSTHWQEPSLDA